MSETPPGAFVKTTPQIGFGTISGIVVSTTEKFLQTFQAALAGAPASITEELFTSFLVNADTFGNQCSEKFAVMIRQSSTQPEVRETTEPVLTRLVRNRCFESPDLVLVDYIQLLAQLGTNIKQSGASLSDSRLRDAAKEVGNDPKYAAKEPRRKTSLPQDLKASALLKILEFLKAMQNLPQELLDYGAIKLFGGDVAFVVQKRYLQTIYEAIQDRLNQATAAVETLEIVKQKKWEEQRASESAAIKAVAMIATQQHTKKKTGMSSLVIGLACTVPVWLVSTGKVSNVYVMGLAVLSGVIGIIFCYLGITRLTRI